MGATGHALADHVWLTSDNPRNEDPAAIAAEVRAGVEGEGASWIVELDRRRAITAAVHAAAAGDVVIIAGKGHEDYQEIKGKKYPFDDRQVVKDMMDALLKEQETVKAGK